VGEKGRFLRKPEVLERTGVSDTTLWRWEQKGLFPKRVPLGPNIAGWWSPEVDAWEQGRLKARSADVFKAGV
jgi:prophage regulatory protein